MPLKSPDCVTFLTHTRPCYGCSKEGWGKLISCLVMALLWFSQLDTEHK